MMLVITTQVYENYGAHDWDGTGECPLYWKAKGGSEYKVLGVPLNIDYQEVVDMVGNQIERYNNYVTESITGWSIESDDYLSDFEQSQLKWDGEIVFKEPEIEYSELNERSIA